MIRLTCAVLLAVLALQCAPALAGTTVRIAVTSGGHGTTSLNPLDRSVKALEARFGPSNVTIRDRVPLTELGHMLERGEVDYFISTSGVSRRNLSEGSRDLLTITDSRFPDPNKSYGSLFFTRRDSGIKRLKDMRGRTLVANHPNGPYSYLVGMGEIERAGYDATAFFKSQRFLMQSAEDVVQARARRTRRRRRCCELHSRGLLPCGLRGPAQTRARGPQGDHPLHALNGPASQLDAFGRARRGSRDDTRSRAHAPRHARITRWRALEHHHRLSEHRPRLQGLPHGRLRRHERKKLQRLRRKVLALRRRASRRGLPLLRLCSPIAPHGRDQDP